MQVIIKSHVCRNHFCCYKYSGFYIFITMWPDFQLQSVRVIKKKKVRGSQLYELGNYWVLPPDKHNREGYTHKKKKTTETFLFYVREAEGKFTVPLTAGSLSLSHRVLCSLCLSWICSAWRQGVAEPLHPPPSASITPRDAVLTITRPTFHTSNIFIHCAKAHYVTSEQSRFPI